MFTPAENRDHTTVAGRVDVIIPLRDGATTILSTLESVVAQTLQPRRIIVVDDGSSDGGANLVRGHPMVDIITTPPIGVSHARNIGIQASRAEYVAFLDSDDRWRSDKLERQMQIARTRPEVSVVTCDQVEMHMNGAIAPKTLCAPRFRGRVFDEVLKRNFDLGGWSSSILARRESLLESGGFDEELQYGEDLDFSIRLARDHLFDFCPAVLTFVMMNPASTTRRPSDARRNLEISIQCLSVIEKWIGAVKVSRRVTRRCLLYILSRYVRRRLGCT